MTIILEQGEWWLEFVDVPITFVTLDTSVSGPLQNIKAGRVIAAWSAPINGGARSITGGIFVGGGGAVVFGDSISQISWVGLMRLGATPFNYTERVFVLMRK